MSILNKFVLKDLSLNKKRTIVTIIGIILSTALLCAVSGMVTSFYKTLLEYERSENGNFHVSIYDMKSEDVEELKKNEEIESFFYFYKTEGYAKLENSKNKYKPYLHLLGFDKDSLNTLKLVEGRLPENDNEILISYHIGSNAKVNYKIGDTLNLSISDRMVDGYKLSQNNPYDEEVEENLEEKYKKEYKIVGVISRPTIIMEPYEAPGYTIVTLDNNFRLNSSENITVSFRYKDSKNYKEKTEKILGITENNENGKYLYEYNKGLLRAEGSALSDSTMSMIYSVAIVVIVIIIISSVFVIKNSFSISITEKIRQYGILSSIGATKKQIKRNVLFEGFVLGSIAIPIGILSGMFAVFVLIHLINYILADALNGIKFVYSVPLIPILISILFASIVIYFSSIFSARKAAKISPIEAIRSNTEIKISSKKVKSSKIIKKLFKVGGDISYKNLKRNKRKYRSTVISLIVSISIFISLSSFLDFGFKMANEYYKELDFNVFLNARLQSEENSKTDITFKDISQLDNISSYSVKKAKGVLLSNSYLSDFGKLYYGPEDEGEQYETIFSIGDEAYKEFIKEIGGSVEDYENKGILIDNTTFFYNNKKKNGNLYNIKAGDTIELKSYTENDDYEIIEKESISIEIAKRTDKMPMGMSEGTGIVISDKMIEQFQNYRISCMYIMSEDADKLCDDIEKLIKSDEKYNQNIYVSNYEESRRSENAMVLVVSIFLYGFITVITLIAVTNIFNTITTTMNLRQKEFAMLKSIGMTKNEFNRMIKLESVFYGSKSLIIGIPIGCIGSYLIYNAFTEGMDMEYKLPITAIILSIIFVFSIVGLIMKYSLDKINKQNIIETIRKENI